MFWGCGCTKGGKIPFQDGNIEPLYINTDGTWYTGKNRKAKKHSSYKPPSAGDNNIYPS
jgi:hypothetical protein